MSITFRPATHDEMAKHFEFYIKHACKVRYKHPIRETYRPRAKNGVAHIQYGNSKVVAKDGGFFVTYKGRPERLEATLCTLESGNTIVTGIRVTGTPW